MEKLSHTWDEEEDVRRFGRRRGEGQTLSNLVRLGSCKSNQCNY